MNRRQFLPGLAVCAGAVAGVGAKLLVTNRSSSNRPAAEPANSETSVAPLQVRTHPVAIAPFADLARMVPAGRAANLLSLLTPCWYPIKTGKVTHAFRLWGAEAEFPADRFTRPFPSPVLSGWEMRGYLLDDAVYRTFAPGASPLLSRSRYGIHVRRTSDQFAGTFTGDLGHADDMLAACGETSLPSTTRVGLPDGEGTLADVVRGSVAEFTIDQELEWTVEAFARYLGDTASWTNSAGEVTTFDQVADRLLARPLGDGVCLGTHVLNALACLYRVNQVHPILSPRVNDAIPRHLKEASLRVTASRTGGGYWAGDWAPGVGGPFPPAAQTKHALAATGHHLEWMSIVPPALRPEPNVIRLAVFGVLGLIDGLTAYERNEAYLDLTHLGRALALMLGRHPTAVVQAPS